MNPASENDNQDSSPTLLSRLAGAFTRRHWSTLVIELALIVVGIVVALSIDDWARERDGQRSEKIYLASLIRYLDQIV